MPNFINNKFNKQIIFYTATSLLFLAGLWIFLKKTKTKNLKNERYKTEKPILRDLVQYVTASGTLEAKDHLSVGSLVSGKVEKILVDDNDIVKKGQLLVILDNGIGDALVKQATGVLEEAQANLLFQEKFYNRQLTIFNASQLSTNTFDQITKNYKIAKAKVTQASAALQRENQQYDNLFIKSPDDGIIISKNVDLGQMITSQLNAIVLFEIARNLRHMEAKIDIDEADVGEIKDGQEAIFTVDTFPTKSFLSKVKYIQYQAKIVDSVVTYAAILDVDNPKLMLRPGMTANVDIKVADSKQVLSVPNKALRINGFKLRLFAQQENITFQDLKITKDKKMMRSLFIIENNTIKQVYVTLGTNNGKYTEIKQGINIDSKVIIEFLEPREANDFLKKIMGGSGGIGK